MKLINYFILIFLVINLNLLKAQNQDLQDEITKNLRCLVCQGQSVYDSDSEFANSLKLLVNKKLADGKNKEEIYHYLKVKYGDWILYNTEFNKNTYFLWLLPILMFIIGGAIIFRLFIIKKTK